MKPEIPANITIEVRINICIFIRRVLLQAIIADIEFKVGKNDFRSPFLQFLHSDNNYPSSLPIPFFSRFSSWFSAVEWVKNINSTIILPVLTITGLQDRINRRIQEYYLVYTPPKIIHRHKYITKTLMLK